MTNAVTTRLLGDRKASVPLQPRRDRANALYRRAVFALDARRTPGSSAADNTIQDLSANALRVQNGTTGNAKIVQDGAGGKALQLHGTSTGYASTPDSAAVSVTGDLDLRCHARLDDWTPAVSATLISKAQFSTTYSYVLSVDGTTGVLRLIVSPDGATLTGVTSSVAPSVADGASLWVRVTWRASDGRVQFFTATDGVNWVQLGTDRTADVGSLWDGPQQLWIGLRQAGGPSNGAIGLIHRAQVYDGIDGTLVADFDPSRDASYSSLSWASSTTGETWTVTPGGADNSDPLLLPAPSEYGVDRYVYLPGIAGNYLSAPDEAALDITGDIDLRVHCALDDWTPSVQTTLVGKWTGANSSYRFDVLTNGGFALVVTADGTTANIGNTNAFASLVDGTAYWLRATRSAATGVVTFEYAPSSPTMPTSWTTVPTTVDSTAGAVFSGSAVLEVGARNAGANGPAQGRFFAAQVYSGIDGSKVFDWSAEDTVNSTHTTYTASTGQTVTVNRATSGRKTVVVEAAKWLLGTDDYLEIPDSPLLDIDAATDFTVLAVLRQHATPVSFGRYADKRVSGTGAGWSLGSSATDLAPYAAFEDAAGDVVTRSNAFGSTTFTAGSLQALGFVVNRTAATLAITQSGTLGATTSTSTIDDASNAVPMRIGRTDGTNYQDFELYAVYIWREALSASELAAIAADWGAA